MWADVRTTVASRTAAFTLSSWASVEPTFTPTRSCCWTRLADFSGWATGPAGDNNTSSSLPSCASLLCSYHLRQLAGVKASCYPHNWRLKDPETHTCHTYTCGCYSCVCHALEECGEQKKPFIVRLDTHRQGGTKWQKVPGRKCTDVKDLISNTGSI